MTNVRCPACQQAVTLDRGYVPMHVTDLQRGQLVTGSKVCEMSNKKVVTELAEATYTNECDDCGVTTSIKITESYPGSFHDGIEPFIEMNCIGCSIPKDGFYCGHEECGRSVVEHTTDFYRVTDTFGGRFPSPDDPKQTVAWRYFATSQDAAAFIALQSNEDEDEDRFEITTMGPGWYDTAGESACDLGQGEPHAGVFKQKYTKTVLVTDNHVINESEETEESHV